MMGDHVHVRLEADVGSHGRADRVRATSNRRATMHLVDLNDR